MLVCPLDCWDVCVMTKNKNKFIPTKKGITAGFLCPKLNNYFKYPKYNPPFDNKSVIDLLKQTKPNRVLFLKGSGNLGILQNVTKLFFEKYGATFAVGSSCDGKGEEGIIKNLGISNIVSIDKIKSVKNIILWGRNVYETNTHLIPFLKNKKVLTIDVRNTKTAKKSDVFYQINANSDIFLAKYLITKNKDYLKYTNLTNIDELENMLNDSVILLGLGVAKNIYGDKTTHTIAYLSEIYDTQVAFLGNSGIDVNNPFKISPKHSMPLFEIEWDKIDVVFIQGANPLISLPNFHIPKNKKVIVFGKYFDETAKIADIFIPTKDFFAKKDVRSSYFHEFMFINENVEDDYGISEYEWTKVMCDAFGFESPLSEDEYIKKIYKPKRDIKVQLKKPIFIDYKIDYNDNMQIVTAKYKYSLNSQFKRDKFAYMNDYEGEIVLKTKVGELKVEIKKNKDIPKNVVFMYAGSDVNKILSSNGENATYSEEVECCIKL